MQPAQIRPAAGTTSDRAAPKKSQSTGQPANNRPGRRNRWLIASIAAGIALVVLAAIFLVRWNQDDTTADAGQTKTPPPCTLLNTELSEKIVPGGAIREDSGQCVIEGSNPQLAPKVSLTVNAVPKQPKLSPEEAASLYVTQAFKENGKRLDGIGDDAASYEPENSGTIIILLRVDNIVVTLTAAVSVAEKPQPAPAEAARAIAADVAQRLRNRSR